MTQSFYVSSKFGPCVFPRVSFWLSLHCQDMGHILGISKYDLHLIFTIRVRWPVCYLSYRCTLSHIIWTSFHLRLCMCKHMRAVLFTSMRWGLLLFVAQYVFWHCWSLKLLYGGLLMWEKTLHCTSEYGNHLTRKLWGHSPKCKKF